MSIFFINRRSLPLFLVQQLSDNNVYQLLRKIIFMRVLEQKTKIQFEMQSCKAILKMRREIYFFNVVHILITVLNIYIFFILFS